MIVSSTVGRVPDHTAEEINERIRRQTRCNVAKLAAAPPHELDRRLRELDEEWDVERLLETNASIAMLSGLALGATVDRRWFAFSAAIAGFLLQHAIQGWCPPIPILRRLGFRTFYEIDVERYALKAIRGDFENLAPPRFDDGEIDALERFEDEGGVAHDEPPVAHRDAIDQLMEIIGG